MNLSTSETCRYIQAYLTSLIFESYCPQFGIKWEFHLVSNSSKELGVPLNDLLSVTTDTAFLVSIPRPIAEGLFLLYIATVCALLSPLSDQTEADTVGPAIPDDFEAKWVRMIEA